MSNHRTTQEVAKRVDPRKLSIQRLEEGGFGLFKGTDPVRTSKGNPIYHPSRRLLEHLIREVIMTRRLDPSRIGPYSFFSTQKDFIEPSDDDLLSIEHGLLEHELLFFRSPGPEEIDQLTSWHFVRSYLEDDDLHIPFRLHSGEWAGSQAEGDQVVRKISKEYRGLSPEQRAVAVTIRHVHSSGWILPLMLVLDRCSGEEYAEAFMMSLGVFPTTFDQAGFGIREIRVQKDTRSATHPDRPCLAPVLICVFG